MQPCQALSSDESLMPPEIHWMTPPSKYVNRMAESLASPPMAPASMRSLSLLDILETYSSPRADSLAIDLVSNPTWKDGKSCIGLFLQLKSLPTPVRFPPVWWSLGR